MSSKLRKFLPLLIAFSFSYGALSPIQGANTGDSNTAAAASDTTAKLNEIERRLRTRSGVTPQMVDDLQLILRDEPNNARAHFITGQVYDFLGYMDLAKNEYAAADKLDPTNADSKLILFQRYLNENNTEAARSLMNYVRKNFPGDPSLVLMDGLLFIKSGRIDLAEEHFERALHTQKNVVGVATTLALFRANQKRYDDAIKLTAMDLKLKPNHVMANLVMGESLLHQKRAAEALPHLERAFRYADEEHKMRAAHGLASALKRTGHDSDALEPALWGMAMSYEDAQLKWAKQRVQVLIKSLPEQVVLNTIDAVDMQMKGTMYQARLHFALGDVYDGLQQYALAEKQYRAGLTLEPKMARAWYRLARDRERMGDNTAADTLYRKAMLDLPDDREVHEAYARFVSRSVVQKNDLAGRLKAFLKSNFQ